MKVLKVTVYYLIRILKVALIYILYMGGKCEELRSGERELISEFLLFSAYL